MIDSNIDTLSGKELDEYGKSIGIPRYQGLGFPEDDQSYRESIKASQKCDGNDCEKLINMHDFWCVCYVSRDDEHYLCVRDESACIFTDISRANIDRDVWEETSSSLVTGYYVVKKISPLHFLT